MLFKNALIAGAILAAAASATPIDEEAAFLQLTKRQAPVPNTDFIVKYARFAGAASVLTNSTWNCTPNCQHPETRGTVVDLYWGSDDFSLSHGYIAHKDDTKEIIVSFRGSKTVTDWISNAKFELHSWPSAISGSKVHKGFYEAYSSVASSVKAAVLSLLKKNPSYSVVYTAHSLGGAQSVLAATDLILSNPSLKPQIKVFTYGQPRTGNSEFASWLSKQGVPIYRVTYHYDIVPRLPGRLLGYAHHDQEVYYPPSGNGAVLCGNSGENSACIVGAPIFKMNADDHRQYPGLHD
ncbi:hypothetical protein GGI12_004047 [Dipsacomyces acuminosporus]|nr:hypothetical protein GGI12_004047 [Dipsacomyces acuminosporus]